jgi:hypothetical protein
MSMAESESEDVLGSLDQEKALGAPNHEGINADPPLEKVPPSDPTSVPDGGKVWIVAFGGFCCL